MKLVCPTCGREIPARDVNISLAIAKCAGCDAVFPFAADLAPGKISSATQERLPVPIPARFQIEELGSELTIRWPWFSHAVWFLLFFCIFWDGFLVVWYGALVTGMAMQHMGAAALLFALFPLIHVGVGIALTYSVLLTFVNRTIIRVVGGELTVRHGPLPYFGNRTVAVFDLNQIYCTEQVRARNRRYSLLYDVNALLSDGTKLDLLRGLDIEQALFLEQKLEQFLKIEDQRVPGEVRS